MSIRQAFPLRAIVRRLARYAVTLLACAICVASGSAGAQLQRAPALGDVRPSAPQARQKLALVIGNGAYRSLVPLRNPENDANDMCSALKNIGFKATCLLNVPTRRELREAIRLFAAEAETGAETFFFYAGHGIQALGENYLIPTEAQIWTEADIDFEGVSISYLMQSLEQARSYPNVIVLDACRDNPFARATTFRVKKGLARVDPPVGTVLAYATSPNKGALDGSGRNGLFTKHLLSRLSEFGVQLDEMFRQVSKGVQDEAKDVYGFEQVPYRSSSYSASYCLAGCDDPRLVDKVQAIEAQRNELNQKLQQVSEENSRLRAQAQSGANEIARLETRVARLAEDEKSKGLPSIDVGRELERAKGELASVKAEQARRDALEMENQRRMMELQGLRAELQKQSMEIEEYRRKIHELEGAGKRTLVPDSAPPPARESPRKPGVFVPSF